MSGRTRLWSAATALLLASLAGSSAVAQVPAGMARIAGGPFQPLSARRGDAPIRIAPFALDTVPVLRAAFDRFVTSHPEWSRGRVSSELADARYLQDLTGAAPATRQPARQVSWHAAAAFCRARSARLPTTSEWEFVARASESNRNAAAGSAFRERTLRLALAADPASFLIGSGFRNTWGVYDLHGGLMEWTLDFQPKPESGLAGAHDGHTGAAACGSGTTQSNQANDYAAFLRASFRAALAARTTAANLGFRCASSLNPGS